MILADNPALDRTAENVAAQRQRILIAEDEFFLADDCADLIRKAGFDVAGPFGVLEHALLALDGALRVDGALLDVNLNGKVVFPLLDAVLARKLPAVLYTGYSEDKLPERYAHVPRFTKPDGCCRSAESLISMIRNETPGLSRSRSRR